MAVATSPMVGCAPNAEERRRCLKHFLLVALAALALPAARAQNEDPNDTGIVVKSPGSRSLVLPVPAMCSRRPKHLFFPTASGGQHAYFMSWQDSNTKDARVDWLDGRNWCRQRCMDLVSLESPQENEFVKQQLRKAKLDYIWTSGRKCNFVGCDKPELRPNNINGWFWSASGVKLLPTNQNTPQNDWGRTGYFNRPQPDNRQYRPIFVRRDDEACLAILSPTLYNEPDGDYHWHDVACYHKKSFMCEDSDELLRYVRSTNPGIAL